jgi:hypothetical protein
MRHYSFSYDNRLDRNKIPPAIYRALFGIVGKNISQMVEAGNIIGAINALGGNKTDNILELVRKNKIGPFFSAPEKEGCFASIIITSSDNLLFS